jgi:amino acid transporter
MNGMIMTGSRIYSSLGADQSLFAWLGRWDAKRGVPFWSLATQMVLILGMIAAVGTEPGREAINTGLVKLGFAAVPWESHRGGFDTLLRCTAPAFWLFFLLVGISLFVLRESDPHLERPFTVPLYPLLPLVFCDTCAYMLYSATAYAGKLALPFLVLVHVGLVFYWFSKKRSSPVKEEQR